MAVNSYTQNLPKDKGAKRVYEPRPQFTIPAADVNLVVEALQDKHASLVKAIKNMHDGGKANLARPLEVRLVTVRRLLDAAQVGWKKPPEIPPEVLAQREAGRFWADQPEGGE